MLLENWGKIKKYYETWWNCQVLDRVPIWVVAPRDDSQSREILSGNTIKIRREERFDKEKVIECAEKIFQATFFGGVAFPCYWPNFGTDILSAYMGADIEFSPVFLPTFTWGANEEEPPPVSWAKWNDPILTDYSDLSVIQVKDKNFYWQKTKEFMRYALEKSQGRYFISPTDIHEGMDSLAVLRGGPQQLCLDLIDNPKGVKKAMKPLWKVWRKIYEESYQITADKQEGSSSWTNLWSPGKGYPVQNDFTCLISTSMYGEFFLEELMNEINYLDYSIYHLDGPDALKHLDMILEIPRLNAVQWVPGAGMVKEGVARWIPIYRKIQAKKKAIQVFCQSAEVDFVLESLKPEGLLIFTSCSSEKEAKELLSHTGWP
ncbi:MAG: hypothetical protein GH144_06915 [Clostridia bacterium]|jgi:hypothetical protein|nr:hypothetical protein [Clostridia bacterium]